MIAVIILANSSNDDLNTTLASLNTQTLKRFRQIIDTNIDQSDIQRLNNWVNTVNSKSCIVIRAGDTLYKDTLELMDARIEYNITEIVFGIVQIKYRNGYIEEDPATLYRITESNIWKYGRIGDCCMFTRRLYNNMSINSYHSLDNLYCGMALRTTPRKVDRPIMIKKAT